MDVSLRPGGVLNGSVVTRSGEAAAETEVLLKQNGQENLRTQTDQNGLFAFFGVRSGLYELWAIGEQGKGRKILRIWADGNGPPRSRPYAIVVLDPQSQQDIVRGQIGPAVFGNGPGILGSSDIHSFVLGSEIALATLIPAITNDNRPPVSP